MKDDGNVIQLDDRRVLMADVWQYAKRVGLIKKREEPDIPDGPYHSEVTDKERLAGFAQIQLIEKYIDDFYSKLTIAKADFKNNPHYSQWAAKVLDEIDESFQATLGIMDEYLYYINDQDDMD